MSHGCRPGLMCVPFLLVDLCLTSLRSINCFEVLFSHSWNLLSTLLLRPCNGKIMTLGYLDFNTGIIQNLGTKGMGTPRRRTSSTVTC